MLWKAILTKLSHMKSAKVCYWFKPVVAGVSQKRFVVWEKKNFMVGQHFKNLYRRSRSTGWTDKYTYKPWFDFLWDVP